MANPCRDGAADVKPILQVLTLIFAQTIRPRVSLVKLTSPWQLGGNRIAFRRSAQESTVAREWQHISHYDILIIWRGKSQRPSIALRRGPLRPLRHRIC